MRKSLSYKILAALMAAGSFGLYAATPAAADGVTLANNNTILCANGNDVVINGNELTSPVMTDKPNLSNVSEVYGIGYKYGNTNFTDTAYDGNVEINGSTFGWVYGGFTSGENATANNNTVTLNGSNINYVYGGQSISGSADTNTVTITGGNYGTVTGGDANSDKAVGTANNNNISIRGNAVINDCIMGGIGYTANKNTVTIKNSTVNLSKNINDPYYGLTGGVGYEGGAQYNQVIITNSTISGNVYGAYIYDSNSKAANDNSITVTGKSDITNAYLYGYGTNSDATGSNNALTLNGWSGTVNSLHNFDSIIFENIDLSQKEITLDVSSEVSGLGDDFSITFGKVKEDSLTAGDYALGNNTITTIKWDERLGNKVDIGEDFADSLPQINSNAYYFADRANSDGIYVNQFSNSSGISINVNKNQADFTATVTKSVLTGVFIDLRGAVHYNSNQTEDTASLTIDNNFETNVATVAGVYAAKKTDGSSQTATGGKVNISGDNITYGGTVYAGYSEGGSVNNNIINVAAGTNAQSMILKGYNSDFTADGNAASGHSGNTLNITGNGSTFNSIENFDVINFNAVALNSSNVLTLQSADLDGTTLNVTSLAGSNNNYDVGDTVTLIKSENAITGTSDGINIDNDIVTAGVARDLEISTGLNADGKSIDMYVEDVSMNDQITLVAQTRAASAAFVNQGTDLISDSLDTISRDDNYGVKTFAAVHGNRSKYDVADDIKINGWSTIVGVGNADKFDNGSEFSWGVFYENGSGNYRTYNEFNNEFFRGDGSLVYNGGGIAARYTNKNGVYTEGSLRAGMLKSDMDNALRDGAGNFYGYESESAYYGAHLGIGKIISLSESSDLDVYGKFFHTYTEGDSFKVANDEFEFGSINSDRLRIGARITSNKENKFSTYYGLAYEYEFNGDADMTAQGLKAPTQSLQGSSVMAEIGFNYQPTPDSPWSFDLNMRGYTGERQGGSFNVQATYTF